jgi:monoamine oxidase
MVEYFEDLKTKCPDACATAIGLEWNLYLPTTKIKHEDTAFSLKENKVWAVSADFLLDIFF